MKITAIHDIVVPIKSAISNAVISFSEMTVSAVAIHTDVVREGAPVIGFGFHSNGRYAQQGILRERMVPRLLGAAPDSLLNDDGSGLDPEKAWAVMMRNEKPGGHGDRAVAVATMDMALWDATAKLESKPLYQVLADRYADGSVDPSVKVYAAGGYYYPGKDISALTAEMRSYLDAGYTTVKMKIGGATLEEDRNRIDAVLKLLPSGDCLCVDANGRFDLPTALEYARALEPYKLKWYEEPGDPLDFKLLAEVAAASATPIATGENLFSTQDSRNLIRYGGLKPSRDFLQMDPALSYGIVEYRRTLEMLGSEGWSSRRCIPHGGHQMALHVAAGLHLGGNESYPGVFLPFGGFADNTPVRNGEVRLSDAPGIGIELNSDLYALFKTLV
ncbi:MAG TPA: mandelate racemase/muconate lactonizing enzyme family protein [Bryobacteraceae bacterium]|nr:mandelate racemase/muconate lactonizing enzyme family protein [Bryobacteraceae bacterium]